MVWQRKDSQAAEMYALYKHGHSLAQVGKAFGVSRQSVFELLKARGWALRSRPKPLPFVTFNDFRYTLRNNGYYGKTKGGRTMLHRDVWQFHNGPIPEGHDVHHIDQNRANNAIENLHLISKSHHGAHHSLGINQNTRKTHCVNGHPFDQENTRIWHGYRICRECQNARSRRSAPR